MRSDAKANKALLAIAKAIEATFSQGDWLELGLLTDTEGLVRGHPRLLRSLEWGDDDYTGCIHDVLPKVLGDRSRSQVRAGDRFSNLEVVEEKVGLERWLFEQDRSSYAELYAGAGDVNLDDLGGVASELGIVEIQTHAARIRRGLRDDPAQAIGSAKEMLETTLKAILNLHGNGPETRLEIPALTKRVNTELGLDAGGIVGTGPGAESRRRVLGSLAQIVQSTAELRNAGLGTGHGMSQGPVLDVSTAQLVVSAAVTVATFYLETSKKH